VLSLLPIPAPEGRSGSAGERRVGPGLADAADDPLQQGDGPSIPVGLEQPLGPPQLLLEGRRRPLRGGELPQGGEAAVRLRRQGMLGPTGEERPPRRRRGRGSEEGTEDRQGRRRRVLPRKIRRRGPRTAMACSVCPAAASARPLATAAASASTDPGATEPQADAASA
jgi:hypothetical protein